MPRANWGILVDYPVILPDPIVLESFNDRMKQYVSFIHNLVFRNATLRQTRDLLLPKLIAGEIDVSEMEIATSEDDLT